MTESTYIGARALTSSSPGLANTSIDVLYDDVNAYSIGHADPKVAAAGDISCSRNSAFGSGSDVGDGVSPRSDIDDQNVCHQRWTSDLICGTTAGQCTTNYAKVLGVGDVQYACSNPWEYDNAWAYPAGSPSNSWKRVQAATSPYDGSWLFIPAAGNHEYYTNSDSSSCALTQSQSEAQCYFQEFNGAAGGTEGDGINTQCDPAVTGPANLDGEINTSGGPAGYFDFDVGTWKIIALNTTDQCSSSTKPSCTTQKTWLDNVLDTNLQPCTLVYFHNPRWSSDGDTSNTGYVAQWWDAMYKGTVTDPRASEKTPDLVINGHDHFYERFNKMDDAGNVASSDGIREIIVGNGGKELRDVAGIRAGSQAISPGVGFDTNDDDELDYWPGKTTGILELVLHPNSYQFRFRPAVTDGSPTNGTFTDPNVGGLSDPITCNT